MTDRTHLEQRLRAIGWTITSSGCWEWNGKKTGRTPETSYGVFDEKRAHRVMYEHFVERIPEGMQLRHKCDNPPCVNPDHLIPGTAADNSRDMVERRRHWRHDRETCDKGHDLTLPGAITRTGPANRCTECYRDRNRKFKEQARRARGVPVKRGLSSEQAADVRTRRAAGVPLKELAAEFGITIQSVCDIAKGRTHADASRERAS